MQLTVAAADRLLTRPAAEFCRYTIEVVQGVGTHE